MKKLFSSYKWCVCVWTFDSDRAFKLDRIDVIDDKLQKALANFFKFEICRNKVAGSVNREIYFEYELKNSCTRLCQETQYMRLSI